MYTRARLANGKLSGKDFSNLFPAHFTFVIFIFELIKTALGPYYVLISFKRPQFALKIVKSPRPLI